jgi:hypothetical protein
LDKEAKVQTPLKARKDLADLLEKLCTEFDWRLDRDNPVLLNCDDQITEAINNTRSRALQALVSFGNWVRRHDENAAVPEIAAILDARFKDDAKHPLTLPERAILGMEFGRIWNLDSKWAVTHKNQFFPQEDIDVWCEAFGNFIRYNRPYEPFFEMLKGDFEFALEHLNDLEKKKSIGRDVVDTLGQHLFTYYLWDVYPLRGEDSFLKLFFEKTTKEKKHWASLFNHVGHILRNTEKLQVRLLEPVKTYFDWRLKVGDPKELRQFTHWLEAKCLEPDWRLDGYLKILEKSADEEVHGISIELEALGSLLESHLGKVVECFAKITESLTEKNSWKVQTKNAQPILQAGLNSADETIQKNAERARENLLKLGRFDFLDE